MNVVLAEWKKEDAESLAILANNKKISDNLRDHFPHPYTFKNAEEWIDLNKNKIPITNFAIRINDQLAGGCGILIKEDVYRCSAEIGYWLGESFWGKGIATSAIRLLIEKIRLDYPFVVRIYAEVFKYNKASMRVLEKNNFYLEGIREKAVIKNNIILNDYVWVKILP